MKINSFIFLFLLFVNLLYSQDSVKKVINYYDNNLISSIGFLKDNKPHGYWINYHNNGNLRSEGKFYNGLLDSTWKYYNIDGSLSQIINYKLGVKDGDWYRYYDKYFSKCKYRNDTLVDTCYNFTYSNKLIQYIPYKNGVPDGIGYEFDTLDNRIITIYTYKNGFLLSRESINRYDENRNKTGKWIEIDSTKKIKQEIYYKNGLKFGIAKTYDLKTDKLKSIQRYEADTMIVTSDVKIHEIKRDYYPNGNIKSIASYYNDLPDGVRRDYDINGKIIASYIFKDGILEATGIIDEKGKYQGKWYYFYENGNVYETGNYRNSLKVGEWIVYDTLGNIIEKMEYLNGILEGEYVIYYENGNIKRKIPYEDGMANGEYVEYDINGELIAKGKLSHDERTGKWIYKVNDLLYTVEFTNDILNGKYEIKNYITKQTLYKGRYFDGQPINKHYTFYDNRETKTIESYDIAGERNGWEKMFNEQGYLIYKVLYNIGDIIKIENDRL
jgi:antitoxin component YwqK of YwqJK toxin-antitoxin module